MRFYSVLALGIAMTASFSAHAQSAANAGKSIVCQEVGFHEETGEDLPLARVTFRLGADGKASSMQIVRPRTSDFAAVNATLTTANATFEHVVEKNEVQRDEESGEPILEDGKPQYQWGIEDIERISVKSKGLSLTVLINDHLYAGRPGSVIAITRGDKLMISQGQGMVGCEGALALKWDRAEP